MKTFDIKRDWPYVFAILAGTGYALFSIIQHLTSV